MYHTDTNMTIKLNFVSEYNNSLELRVCIADCADMSIIDHSPMRIQSHALINIYQIFRKPMTIAVEWHKSYPLRIVY